MDACHKISTELRASFSEHSIFKILLPLDVIIIYGCVGAMVLNNFIHIGGLLDAIAYYGFFMGLILAFSNEHNKVLYTGLFVYVASEAFQVLKYGILESYRFLDYHSLITAAIFGYMGYLVYKLDIKASQN